MNPKMDVLASGAVKNTEQNLKVSPEGEGFVPSHRETVRATVNGSTYIFGVPFWDTRRRVDGLVAAGTVVLRTVQLAPNVCPRPSQDQPPAVFQGVIHRRTDVLVPVLVHLSDYSSTTTLGEEEA